MDAEKIPKLLHGKNIWQNLNRFHKEMTHIGEMCVHVKNERL